MACLQNNVLYRANRETYRVKIHSENWSQIILTIRTHRQSRKSKTWSNKTSFFAVEKKKMSWFWLILQFSNNCLVSTACSGDLCCIQSSAELQLTRRTWQRPWFHVWCSQTWWEPYQPWLPLEKFRFSRRRLLLLQRGPWPRSPEQGCWGHCRSSRQLGRPAGQTLLL